MRNIYSGEAYSEEYYQELAWDHKREIYNFDLEDPSGPKFHIAMNYYNLATPTAANSAAPVSRRYVAFIPESLAGMQSVIPVLPIGWIGLYLIAGLLFEMVKTHYAAHPLDY